MKRQFKILVGFILCGIIPFLSACTVKSNVSEPTPIIESVNLTPAVASNTPTITSEPIQTSQLIQDKLLAQEMKKDIDQNGVIDSVQIKERDNGTEFIQVILNGENIFQYEWADLRLISIDTFENIDLDQDGENEIFITVDPNVNSRPLIEVLTLKQVDDQWLDMEMPQNELGNNCIPFQIARGKEEFDFIISSEYTEQKINFDASSYYEDGPESNPNSLQGYRNNQYKEGDRVAFISSWGIWEAKTGTYDDYPCIIAQQGIESPSNNCLGRVIIYYHYDQNGAFKILNVEFVSSRENIESEE